MFRSKFDCQFSQVPGARVCYSALDTTVIHVSCTSQLKSPICPSINLILKFQDMYLFGFKLSDVERDSWFWTWAGPDINLIRREGSLFCHRHKARSSPCPSFICTRRIHHNFWGEATVGLWSQRTIWGHCQHMNGSHIIIFRRKWKNEIIQGKI